MQAVLGGTVRRDGNMLRLTAHLTSITDGSELWSDKFDRTASGIFAMQDALTREIMSKLNLTLSGAKAVDHGTRNIAAYDLYLRGRYFANKRTRTSLDSAVRVYNEAVAIDSTYAFAYAGLADSWALAGAFGYGSPADNFPKARVAAEKAIRLDSTLAEPHSSLGMIALFYEWDYPRAAHEFDRAAALNPNYAATFLFRGWLQAVTGHTDSAIATLRHARELEPVNLTINVRVASMLEFAGRYDEAERQLKATLNLDSTFYITRAELARVYTVRHRYGDAQPFVPDLSGDVSRAESGVASYFYGATRRTQELRRTLALLRAVRVRQYVSSDGFVSANAWLGDRDAAFAELDRAVQEKDWSALMIGLFPEFASLRSDPRFARIRRATHLEGVPLSPVPW